MAAVKFNEKIGGKDLPAESVYWPCFHRRVFRYIRKHFPETVWLGTTVRRRSRDNPNAWSTHSHPGQATDFKPKNTQAGDTIVRRLRRRFPLRIKIVWEAALHRKGNPEHFHLENNPSISRFVTPPFPPYKKVKCVR